MRHKTVIKFDLRGKSWFLVNPMDGNAYLKPNKNKRQFFKKFKQKRARIGIGEKVNFKIKSN